MLTSKAKLILAAALAGMVAGVIAGVVAYRNADLLVSHYPTMKEALDDGARERGWLPSFVPDSAFDLHEAHDLDTNLQWGTFRFGAADAARLIGMLVAAEKDCQLRVPDPGLEGVAGGACARTVLRGVGGDGLSRVPGAGRSARE